MAWYWNEHLLSLALDRDTFELRDLVLNQCYLRLSATTLVVIGFFVFIILYILASAASIVHKVIHEEARQRLSLWLSLLALLNLILIWSVGAVRVSARGCCRCEAPIECVSQCSDRLLQVLASFMHSLSLSQGYSRRDAIEVAVLSFQIIHRVILHRNSQTRVFPFPRRIKILVTTMD